MLVLSRKADESVVIGEDIVITVLEVRGDVVRLGISAPREVKVHRSEVYAVFSLPGDDYPGETDTDRLAKGGCDRRLTDRFGASASYDYHYLLPTAESWATGDREVTCVARNPDGRQLTGPLRPS